MLGSLISILVFAAYIWAGGELIKNGEKGNILVSEKGIFTGSQARQYVWNLELEENTTITINFKSHCHDFSRPTGNNELQKLTNYKLVKWNSTQYNSFWELYEWETSKGVFYFTSPEWLEVLPDLENYYPIYTRDYSEDHYLTEGSWVVYIPGASQEMIYEITITQKTD